MKISTTFYSRTITENKYSYKKECDGEIYGKNIWVKKAYDLPGCGSLIANFEYLYNKSYLKTSENKVNTHFKYKISRSEFYNEPLFANLSLVQRFKLKIMMGETGFQRNPIEFWLLLVTFFGVLIGLIFGILNRQDQILTQKQIINELQELRKEIKTKEFKVESNIVVYDSLTKSKSNESE